VNNVDITFICKAQEKEQEIEISISTCQTFFLNIGGWSKSFFFDCYSESGGTAMKR